MDISLCFQVAMAITTEMVLFEPYFQTAYHAQSDMLIVAFFY